VLVAPPPQSVPAGRQLVAPGAVTVPHVPSAAPPAFWQSPAQHSKSVEHTSPVCTQNEGLPHTPALHVFEQHSAPVVHGLPEVRHAAFKGVHVPPPAPSGAQRPPQQSPSVPHAPLSATHCLFEHVPPVQENVQHSLPVAQVAPGALHAVIGAAHFLEVPSQFAVQQSKLDAQSWPTSLHVAESARPPSVIASTNASRAPPSFPGGVTLPSAEVVPSWPEPVSSPASAMSTFSLPQPVNTKFAHVVPTRTMANATGSRFIGAS